MEEKSPIIKLKSVSKFYYNKGLVASGFNKVNLELYAGEFVVITGESGSGKSTLLNVISGLDSYEEGEMYIYGKETSHYTESDFELYRKTYIGNIFQSFNLVNSYTVYQNVELVLLLNGYKNEEIKKKTNELLKEVDLYQYRNKRVSHLSGGQKQRVAIARALAKDTPIIIADEPTGNLDVKSAKNVLELLSKLSKNKLVVVVTHNYEQVEKYATRKIEMHDGKIREDINLKEVENNKLCTNVYKNMGFKGKLKLGIRNTYSIIPKFVLMFIVFAFLSLAFLGATSLFKKTEYEESSYNYNYFFNDTSATRIIINKNDHSSFSEDELSYFNNLDHVAKIVKNDLIIDSIFSLNSDDYYYSFYGPISSLNEISKVDKGRLPENANEVVVTVNKLNYYISQDFDKVVDTKLTLTNPNGTAVANNLTVVGAIFCDNYDDEHIYVDDSLMEDVNLVINSSYSSISTYMNKTKYDYEQIVPLRVVPEGTAYVSSDLNSRCLYNWCLNKNIDIEVNNLYYTEKLSVVVSKVYYKSNFKAITGFDNYDNHSYEIYISYEDYNKLFNKDSFQISIYADDGRNVDKIVSNLNANTYRVLKLKNAKDSSNSNLLAAIKVIKTVVLIAMFIVLFFITYFVIKLIQKSKNIYYSTVRILGGSFNVVKSLIRIELLNICNVTYVLVMAFIILVNRNIIKVEYIRNIISFLTIKDYVFIYIIMILMSLLISWKYSRSLFKNSAMNVYRQEV